MLCELSSGTGASSDHTALLMMLVGEDSFRKQVLALLNAFREDNPVVPEVYEGGQVHVLRLGFMKHIDTLIGKMGKPNNYEGSDAIVNPIRAIQFDNRDQEIDLNDILPGFNLWQVHDVRYAVQRWNEDHEGKAIMSVDMDYAQPNNIKLCISRVA